MLVQYLLKIRNWNVWLCFIQIKSNRESTESPVTIQEAVIPQNTDQLPDILSEPSGTKKRPTDSGSQPR